MESARRIDAGTLTRLRSLDANLVLPAICTHFKLDPTYCPLKDPRTCRWHVRTTCGEFELLAMGCKWFDTRSRIGGGGAVDLAMYLLRLDFLDAVALLEDGGL